MSSETPRFAITGHPNKGKSSIVATLAEDDSVVISSTPGTTERCRSYPMVIDGIVIYELIDTPGFQRARAAMDWMQSHVGSVVERPEVISHFIRAHKNDNKFEAECELLAPIMSGAGILYVVDGSLPWGPEYEAEMEILRWTGQPSMALINQIGKTNYVEQWQSALSQYFRIVRRFNAQTADFDRRINLLKAFGQIKEEWNPQLLQAVKLLNEQQHQRRIQAAASIAMMIAETLTLNLSKTIPEDKSTKQTTHQLEQKLLDRLRKIETSCRREVESIYDYKRIARDESALDLLEQDLFSEQTWTIFGLSNDQLITTGAIGGAATGGLFDLAVGGHSLMLGAGIGGIIGGISAWLTGNKLAKISVQGVTFGGKKITVGPVRSIQFPYILLGRALIHLDMLVKRTHAIRDLLILRDDTSRIDLFSSDQQAQLEKHFTAIRSNKSWRQAQENLKNTVLSIVEDEDDL